MTKAMNRQPKVRQPLLSLRLTPYAWAKLLFLRDLGDTEVGGFGISAADDLLLVENVCLVRQRCTPMTVKFDDGSVADHFEDCVSENLKPERFARIWVHTHPGSSARPSSTDEDTFARCFGLADWALMFILAAGGQTYARLHFRAGPGGDVELPAEVDYSEPFPASDEAAWEQEYLSNVYADIGTASAVSQLDRQLAEEFFGPMGSMMYPDELGPFDPFLEDLHGFDRSDRSVRETERIATAVCA